MIKICEYPNCHRPAYYLNSWENKDGRHSGLVCATHDRELGRINLCKTGFTVPECILFERYLKETVTLESYPDWPEWLKQYVSEHGKPYYCGTAPAEASLDELDLHELNLSNRTFNALYRYQIRTIDDLTDMTLAELTEIRWLGEKGVAEIQKALKDYSGQN